MLREAGYRQRSDARELVLQDPDNDIEFFFLRPRDIAVYVGSGQLDVGITGRDLLLDSGAAADEILPLGFAASTFRFAARPGTATSVAELQGLRVAAAYPGLVAGHLAKHGVTAEVIRLDGAVETAVRLGVADVIADVVETGGTLRQAGLEIFGDPILQFRGGARPPTWRRADRGRRPADPSDPGRHRRPYVRPDGLRHRGRARRAGRAADAGHRVADHLAAARVRLGRRPRDGAAQGDQQGDGRPLGPRRPRHPRHRHPRLPPLAPPRGFPRRSWRNVWANRRVAQDISQDLKIPPEDQIFRSPQIPGWPRAGYPRPMAHLLSRRAFVVAGAAVVGGAALGGAALATGHVHVPTRVTRMLDDEGPDGVIPGRPAGRPSDTDHDAFRRTGA